jgi:hypothetical protein
LPLLLVQVVKLPLNALTVAALHSIATVRGISDMSVERMIEQHLAKGNLVVLHLEECPQQPELQEALFAGVQRTLASLRSRYAHRMGNVVRASSSVLGSKNP